MSRQDQAGFTLIELLLAMTLFSLMMLIVVSGFLNVVRLRSNGIAARDTQQNARFGLEQIVRETRSAADVQVLSGKICLADLKVRFYIDSASPKRLHRDKLDATHTCALPGAGPGDTAITSDEVNVVDLEGLVIQTPAIPGDPPNPKSLQITLLISSRDVSQLDPITGKTCDPLQHGSEFCSTTKLVSTVTLRGTP